MECISNGNGSKGNGSGNVNGKAVPVGPHNAEYRRREGRQKGKVGGQA